MPARPDVLKLKYSTDSDASIRGQIGAGGGAEIEPGELVVGMSNYKARLYTKDAYGRIVNVIGAFDNVQTVDGGDFDSGLPGIAIGEPYLGGFFAGYISYAGNGIADYGLIVSPRAEGRLVVEYPGYTPRYYDGFYGSYPSEPNTSLYDGFANTDNVNDGHHAIAAWARSLTIGGYTDWYIPARNELDIILYNLKADNAVSATTYPGDTNYGGRYPDWYNVGSSLNNLNVPNNTSSPPYTPWVLGDPLQTGVPAFQDTGSERLDTSLVSGDRQYHVCSTAYSDYYMYMARSSGGWDKFQKSGGIYSYTVTRAIRRFAI